MITTTTTTTTTTMNAKDFINDNGGVEFHKETMRHINKLQEYADVNCGVVQYLRTDGLWENVDLKSALETVPYSHIVTRIRIPLNPSRLPLSREDFKGLWFIHDEYDTNQKLVLNVDEVGIVTTSDIVNPVTSNIEFYPFARLKFLGYQRSRDGVNLEPCWKKG